MKVTIETTTTKEVELPKFFKNNGNSLFMITGDEKSYVKVYDVEYSPELSLMPYIKVDPVSILKYDNISDVKQISEHEFKLAFIRVSCLIDELFNN